MLISRDNTEKDRGQKDTPEEIVKVISNAMLEASLCHVGM
jgi:hypothetical protein